MTIENTMSEEATPPQYHLIVNALEDEDPRKCGTIYPPIKQEFLENLQEEPIIDEIA